MSSLLQFSGRITQQGVELEFYEQTAWNKYQEKELT